MNTLDAKLEKISEKVIGIDNKIAVMQEKIASASALIVTKSDIKKLGDKMNMAFIVLFLLNILSVLIAHSFT